MDGYERLPWRTVDWLAWKSLLGYFLLFECMLESIIFARNHYLDKETGLGEHHPVSQTERMKASLLVLPDDFSIHLSGFHSESLYHENLGFWSDVYGFEMNTVAKNILLDGHVMVVPADDLMTDDCCIKVESWSFERKKISSSILTRIWMRITVPIMISPLLIRSPFESSNPVRSPGSSVTSTCTLTRIWSKR